MEGAAKFMGIDLVNEKELVLIVSRTSEKNAIMKAIMTTPTKRPAPSSSRCPSPTPAGLRLLDERVKNQTFICQMNKNPRCGSRRAWIFLPFSGMIEEIWEETL